MKKLIAYFIKYPIAGNTVLAMLAVFGIISYSRINSSFFPLVESRIINVQLIYPGASPSEMEEGVVSLVEKQLEGISGIERITSASNENSALITIEVFKGYYTSQVLEDVKNAVSRINGFPTGLEIPQVFLRENINFTINYAVSGENIDLRSLKAYARKIEKDLLAHEGISKVELAGYPLEEIEVALNEDALRAYGLTLEQAGNIIRSSNIDITGGSVKTSEEELLIRSRNKGYYARELENLVLKSTPEGAVVRIKDVADVQDRWAEDPNRIFINGNPGVEVLVSSTDQEDLLSNAAYVREYFKQFSSLNPQLKVTLIRDQSVTLLERRDLLLENGLIGTLLVLVLLSIFLSRHLAFWVAAGIPVSFLGMFILALYYGVTINVISLFGMIVVVGILVDDGIVISENIFSHYEKGKNGIKAAIDGTMEVLPAVFSSVITTMIAFSFFFLVDGRAGDFFSELSFVVIATLFVSLIEAALILPAHLAHSKAMKEGSAGKKNFLEKAGDRIIFFMRDRMFARVLAFSLKHKFLVFAIPVALLMITIGAMKGSVIKFTFFPVIERNEIPVALSMPAGTLEHLTLEKLEDIEKAIFEVNEDLKKEAGNNTDIVTKIERKIGPKSHEGSINAILVGSEERNISSIDLAQRFRQKLGPVPEAEKLTFGNASAFGKPVSISFQGQDQRELDLAKEELKQAMKQLPELKDVVETVQQGSREIHLKLSEKAYILGFTEAQIMNQVRQGYFGFEAQRLQRGSDEVKVWVRYDRSQRSNIQRLEEMRIRTLDGKEIPLSELAEVSLQRGVSSISHLDGQKQITVEAELTNSQVSAPAMLAQIRKDIIPGIMARHPGITALYEGQNREADKTQKSSKFALPFVLISILAIITFTFRSFWQALIILLFLIPFSFIGVAWGHFIHGQQLSILSFLGVVALIGIIVNDSLVLIEKMNGFLKEGMKFSEAVYQAAFVRFRAIFLTSITTIAGLAPLILERSFQAQFLIPMAISVAYGIAVATVLTLIILPVLLHSWNDLRRKLLWLWNGGVMPSAEEIEPAVKELKSDQYELES